MKKKLNIKIDLKIEELKKKLGVRDAIHVGKNPPINPKKGDLWYKD